MKGCLWPVIVFALFVDVAGRAFQVGSLWLVVSRAGSGADAALYMVVSQGPATMLLPIYGYVLDRTSRKGRLLAGGAAVGLVPVVVLALLATAGKLSIPSLFAGAALLSISIGFLQPAINVVIPYVVPKSRLQRANSLRAISYRGTQIFGPVLAGVVMAWGFGPLYGLVGLLLMAATLMAIPIRNISHHGDISRTGAMHGWRVLLSNGRARGLLVAEGAFALSIAPVAVVLPVFVLNVLGGTNRTYSLLLGCVGVGGLASALVLSLVKPIISPRVLAGSLAVAAAGALLTAMALNTVASCIGMAVFGVDIVGWGVLIRSFEQAAIDSRLHGRFFSAVQGVMSGVSLLGYALAGILLAMVDAQEMMLCVALGMAASGILSWMLPSLADVSGRTVSREVSLDPKTTL